MGYMQPIFSSKVYILAGIKVVPTAGKMREHTVPEKITENCNFIKNPLICRTFWKHPTLHLFWGFPKNIVFSVWAGVNFRETLGKILAFVMVEK